MFDDGYFHALAAELGRDFCQECGFSGIFNSADSQYMHIRASPFNDVILMKKDGTAASHKKTALSQYCNPVARMERRAVWGNVHQAVASAQRQEHAGGMALGKRDSPIAEMPPDKPPETGVFLKGRCDDRFALAEGEGSGSQQLVQRRAGEKVKGGKGSKWISGQAQDG